MENWLKLNQSKTRWWNAENKTISAKNEKKPKKSMQLMWLKAKLKIMTLKRCSKILKLDPIPPHQARNPRRPSPRKNKVPTMMSPKLSNVSNKLSIKLQRLNLQLQIVRIALSASVQGNRLLWLNLADMPPFVRVAPNAFPLKLKDAQCAKLLSLAPKESFNKLMLLLIPLFTMHFSRIFKINTVFNLKMPRYLFCFIGSEEFTMLQPLLIWVDNLPPWWLHHTF